MKTTIMLGAFALGLGLAATASAQDRVRRLADRTEYKAKTVIDFGDVTIQGELTRPQGAYLLNRRKTRFQSLLKVRDNFLRELQTSTDNI
ncbi:MAG: hypothetical protein AAGD10_04110 [Myxococcota bacterium]